MQKKALRRDEQAKAYRRLNPPILSDQKGDVGNPNQGKLPGLL
jgi:hypothetical protein